MRDYELSAGRRPLKSRRDVSDNERGGPSSAASELFQPFLFQPFLLLFFDFLIVLRQVLPNTTLTHANLVTEAFHLPVIKAIQNLEGKIDPPGGTDLPLLSPGGCARKPRRTPIAGPGARLCDLDAMFLIPSRKRLCILVSGTDQIRPQKKQVARLFSIILSHS